VRNNLASSDGMVGPGSFYANEGMNTVVADHRDPLVQRERELADELKRIPR